MCVHVHQCVCACGCLCVWELFVFRTANELTSALRGEEKNIFKELSTAYYLSVTTAVQGISGLRLWGFYSFSATPVLSLQAISPAEAQRDRLWSLRGAVGLRQQNISLSKEN